MHIFTVSSTETNIKNYSYQNEDSSKTQIKGPRRKITPTPLNQPPNRIIHGYSKVRGGQYVLSYLGKKKSTFLMTVKVLRD